MLLLLLDARTDVEQINVFSFQPPQGCVGNTTKLAQLKSTHEAIMTLLMDSNTNLRTKLFEFLQLLNKFDVIESVKKTRNIEDFRNKVLSTQTFENSLLPVFSIG